MASLSQILAHIYTFTTLFLSILLLELSRLLRGAARAAARSSSMTTEEFLRVVDKKAPARPFEAGPEPQECSVCLSPCEQGDEVRKLKCAHAFHKGCLDTWLQQDAATCPLCRSAVLPAAVVVKHRNYRMEEHYGGSDEELMLVLYALHGNFRSRFF